MKRYFGGIHQNSAEGVNGSKSTLRGAVIGATGSGNGKSEVKTLKTPVHGVVVTPYAIAQTGGIPGFITFTVKTTTSLVLFLSYLFFYTKIVRGR